MRIIYLVILIILPSLAQAQTTPSSEQNQPSCTSENNAKYVGFACSINGEKYTFSISKQKFDNAFDANKFCNAEKLLVDSGELFLAHYMGAIIIPSEIKDTLFDLYNSNAQVSEDLLGEKTDINWARLPRDKIAGYSSLSDLREELEGSLSGNQKTMLLNILNKFGDKILAQNISYEKGGFSRQLKDLSDDIINGKVEAPLLHVVCTSGIKL